jgi:hypothetical protein
MSRDGNRNPDSPPPGFSPALGSPRTGGEAYEGTQNEQVWAAGQTDRRGIIDATRKAGLYRLTLLGHNVLCNVRYGTNATLQLVNLRAPVVLTLPGQVGVSCQPIDGAGAAISATLVRVTAASIQHARRRLAGAVAINEAAVSFFTLEACSLTIDGQNYPAVPAFTRVPLIQPAALVTGSGFEEFDP